MADVHATGGWFVLAAIVAYLVLAVVFARFADPPAWFESARRVLLGVVGVQLALGLLAYADGRRPAESLHLLYGVAVLGVLPLTGSFAAEAPPRARSGVMAAGAVVMLALLWRTFTTG